MLNAAHHERLSSEGIAVLSALSASEAHLVERVSSVAASLGTVLPGRGKRLIEYILPKPADAAIPGSLSSKYGLGTLPLHTDTAHWSTPCRYLVIACVSVGPVSTPTMFLDSHRVALDDEQLEACRKAVFLVRNGRRSFYSSIREKGSGFTRLDSGCMTPTCNAGLWALGAFTAERNHELLIVHNWQPGEIAILDNWRILHGRGEAKDTAPGRVLLRAMVK